MRYLISGLLFAINFGLWSNLLLSCATSHHDFQESNKSFLEELNNQKINVDIVHVDTGNKTLYNNEMLYYPNTSLVSSTHGTEMVKVFSLQLQLEGLKGIKGRQITVSLGDHSMFSSWFYLKGLSKLKYIKTKVLSISASGDSEVQEEYDLLQKYACNKNVLVVVASGNEENKYKVYPASYPLDCLISVGTKENGKLASYSNSADVYLEQFPAEYGTSYSTARFGAVVLKEIQNNPFYTIKELKQLLIQKYGK